MIFKFIKNQKDKIAVFLIILITVLAYLKLFGIFYQQDEWFSFGKSLSIKSFTDIFHGLNYFQIIMGQGRFIPYAIGYLFFKYFPFNPFPFALFSIIFHCINALLVFKISNKVVKNILFSSLAALFFALNSVSSNSVSWFGTSGGTLPAVTLILISVITFFKYLEKNDNKLLFLTFIFLYFSLFFKEIGIQYFIFFPILTLLYKKCTLKEFVSKYWFFVAFFVVNTMFRVYGVRFQPQEMENLFLRDSSSSFWLVMVIRIVLYPLTSFPLVYIHPTPFLNFSNIITRIYYPNISAQEFPLVVQTNTSDFLSILLSLFLFFIVALLFRLFSDREKKSIVFWTVFSLTSYLPYTLIAKNFTYLESRYYYLPAISGGILLFLILSKLYHHFKNNLLKIILVLLSTFFIFWHFKWLDNDLIDQVKVSSERVSFLRQLSSFVPKLIRDKNVFLINSNADYYTVGNKIPFQQGSGYTIMMLYHKRGFPQSFFNSGYLYDLNSQGYREEGGLGFGYYWDKNLLNKDILLGKFKREDVVSFFYNSSTNILTKVSELPK